MRRVQAPHVGTQFRQLPMFMSAHEIRSQYQGLDGDRDDVMDEFEDRPETDEELFQRKSHEAEWEGYDGSPSLWDRLEKEGVKNPISLQADHTQKGSLGRPEILGGHHRVAVMSHIKPHALMPVEHFENYEDAQRSLGDRY